MKLRVQKAHYQSIDPYRRESTVVERFFKLSFRLVDLCLNRCGFVVNGSFILRNTAIGADTTSGLDDFRADSGFHQYPQVTWAYR